MHPRPPQDAHPVLLAAALAALEAYGAAAGQPDLAAVVADGADGTPTMRIDLLVEDAVLAALPPGVNVLTEESGWLDRGSALTLVMDPVDGSANAAAGVPLAAFSAALAVDGGFTEALTVWLDTGRSWWAIHQATRQATRPATHPATHPATRPTSVPRPTGSAPPRVLRTTGRRGLDGAAVSLLRPHPRNPGALAAWMAVAERAARVRILSSSCLESALVAQGATDAFADAASDTHRLVDIAAAVVLAGSAGGAVRDVFGRAVELDTDLTRRWSGVVAATPDLADELATVLHKAATTAPHP